MDLEIIIPIETADSDLVRGCLQGIVDNTILREHIVTGVAIDKDAQPKEFLSFGGTTWSLVHYRTDYTASIFDAIDNSKATYVAIVPPTHHIADDSWFGKMQLPFLRTPNCGLAIAAEDLAGTSQSPFPWSATASAPGRLVLGLRMTVAAIARTAELATALDRDYAKVLHHAAKRLGLTTWAIPGVKIDVVARSCAATAPDRSE